MAAAAGILAGGSLLGGVLGGKGAKKAANAQLQGTQQEIAAAERNRDFQYRINAPTIARGDRAGDAIADFLGIKANSDAAWSGGGASPVTMTGNDPWATALQGIASQSPNNIDWAAFVNAGNGLAQWNNQTPDLAPFGGDITKFGRFFYQNDKNTRADAAQNPIDLTPYQQAPGAVDANTGAASGALSTYRASTGYQDLLDSGLKAVNANAYAKGMGNSGAALKALQAKGSAIADQSAQTWLSNLGGLEAGGRGALGNVAGVGANATNAITGAIQSGADASGNAALATASAYQKSLQGLANAGANYFGSSYSPPGSGYLPGTLPPFTGWNS